MRIIVIGEICEDVFVYGESKRLSPEAPVPVFIPKYTTINNGMCGNVMENLKGLLPDADINYVPQQAKITKTMEMVSVSKMKKAITVLAISTLTLTSCSSGWSCQKRYVNAKQTKTIEQKKNA